MAPPMAELKSVNQTIVEMRRDGKSVEAIASSLGLSTALVEYLVASYLACLAVGSPP